MFSPPSLFSFLSSLLHPRPAYPPLAHAPQALALLREGAHAEGRAGHAEAALLEPPAHRLALRSAALAVAI